MQSEDQYVERTPDLVAKIRAMREAAEKQMNRFTRVADYEVRHVVGRMPKAPPESRQKKVPAAQIAIDFTPASAERGDDGEAA